VSGNGASYSVGATLYCGTSPSSYTGNITYNNGQPLTGYFAAKAICQTSSGCGSSLTAHMCTGEELVRSASLGTSLPSGVWYSSGAAAQVPSGYVGDCNGWTSTANAGSEWTAGSSPNGPDYQNCSVSQPIACCD
jgi:hypothetical protein